jgi:hypothetical protein
MSIDIDRLARMAGGCETALRARFDALDGLQAELDALEGTTCTGREWWRDRDHPTKTPKLYILHSIDQVCPLHGEPEAGGRLRCYVGSGPGKIDEARVAMEREQKRRELERELSRLRGGLASCGYHLRAFYDLLGYQVGEDGQARPR